MTTHHKHSTDEELGDPTEPYDRIPAVAKRAEEAAFWDTHDLTDVDEEMTPVAVTIGEELASRVANRVTVPLEPAEREALVQRARQQGTDPSALIHTWVKERLQQEAAAPAR